MMRHIPNLLTSSRFFMAIAYFIVVGFYDRGTPASWPILDIALGMFIVGVLTDTIDGYLARRLGHLTTFGRIADPFVDKIIVCGALVYFMGNQFLALGPNGTVVNLTGWRPVDGRRDRRPGTARDRDAKFQRIAPHSLCRHAERQDQDVRPVLRDRWGLFYVEHWADGPVWTGLRARRASSGRQRSSRA